MIRGHRFAPVEAAAAYDGYADRYDRLLDENLINAYMRRAMVRFEGSTFRPGERLLEIGCGTGDEALALAEHGCQVVALDPSREMIRVAQGKARDRPFGTRVRFLVGSAAELGTLLTDEADGAFDGAFSSFALSYEGSLPQVVQALTRLIRQGGTLITSSMNRLSGMEWTLALASLHPQWAGRRLRHDTLHKVGAARTKVYCRTPSEMARAFHPGFRVVRRRALPALLPPHYANRPLLRWPGLLEAVEKVDSRVAGWPLVRDLGDHNVLWMLREG